MCPKNHLTHISLNHKSHMINKKMVILALFTFMLFFCSCNLCSLFGSYNLGNQFVLLDGDKMEDRMIVYNTTKEGCCHSGIPIIPSRLDTVTKYVHTALSNKEWIIARAITNEKQESYWIVNKNFSVDVSNCEKINCDSIIQSHVIGPLDFKSFKKKIRELNIELSFKE